MIEWLAANAATSTLAFVTTIHVSFVLLRWHRSATSRGWWRLVVPSAGLAASPWLLPTHGWLIVGLVAQAAWFVACERLAPPSPASRPAVPARADATRAVARSVAPTTAVGPDVVMREFAAVPVLAVFHETEDIRTFRLARPAGFSFRPGQFLTVRVQADGRPLVRCYSISSAPEASGYLEISVKRQGIVSSTLHATARPGSMLSIKGPAGVFTYPDGDDRPIVFLAGGVGITPLMSMFRHGVAAEPTRPLTLMFSVHGHAQLAYRRELEWLAERHPQSRVAVVVSQGPRASGHFPGPIGEGLIRELVPDVVNSIFMICGPSGMMDAMRQTLAAMGVPDGQIRHEAFEAAIALADRRPPAAGGATAGAVGRKGEFTLTLSRTGSSTALSARQTLLEAAESAGAEIPSSCRAGVCLTCRSRLADGRVDCQSDGLDPADRDAGYILPCVSWAKSDCTLDA